MKRHQVTIAADHDWESTVTSDTTDVNSASWQILKDKSSPKHKRKLGGSKKLTNGKDSPRKDTRPAERNTDEEPGVWRRRERYI